MHFEGCSRTFFFLCHESQSVLLQLPSKTLEYGVGGEDSLPTRKGSVILDEDCLIPKKKLLKKPSVWTKQCHQFLAMLAVPVHSKPILEYDMSG